MRHVIWYRRYRFHIRDYLKTNVSIHPWASCVGSAWHSPISTKDDDDNRDHHDDDNDEDADGDADADDGVCDVHADADDDGDGHGRL